MAASSRRSDGSSRLTKCSLLGIALMVSAGLFTGYNMQISFGSKLDIKFVEEAVYEISGALGSAFLGDSDTSKVKFVKYESPQHRGAEEDDKTSREQSKLHPHRRRIHASIDKSYGRFRGSRVLNETVDITQNRERIEHYSKPTEEPVYETSGTESSSSDPLNIVLFYADDWTLKVLGALNEYVMTPHIDALARDGMLFPHNCVTTSICWISRGTLATGTYAAVHNHLKIADNNLFTNPHFKWKDTLYPLLKQAGYYSGHIGKWHGPIQNVSDTFDVFSSYYGRHWENRGGQPRHVTDLNGEDSLNFLRRRPRDKLFHLTVAFFATHAQDYHDPPYNPMNESKLLYLDKDIPEVRTNTEEHWKSLPWFFEDRNEGRRRYKGRFDTPENYQRNLKDLYRMATEVDSVVGAVVEELQAQGVYDKTLIMFTTDNGNLHGEHGMAEKWYPFEESIRVPLVVRDPRMPKEERGKVNDEFTLSVDLAPTMLRAANITVPDFMQGRDMAEIYLDPPQAAASWRKDFFYEWTQGEPVNAEGHNVYYHIPAVFAVIRKDWKYFYWPQVKYEQLFQIEKDPDEEFDVLNSTATTTKEALAFMRARYEFLKNYSQTGNPV